MLKSLQLSEDKKMLGSLQKLGEDIADDFPNAEEISLERLPKIQDKCRWSLKASVEGKEIDIDWDEKGFSIGMCSGGNDWSSDYKIVDCGDIKSAYLIVFNFLSEEEEDE